MNLGSLFSQDQYDDISTAYVKNDSSDDTAEAPHTKITIIPASTYNTFTELTRVHNETDVSLWLRKNNFDEKTISVLNKYTGADLLMMSKDDLKDLLSTKDALRLHARLQQVRETLNMNPDEAQDKKYVENVLNNAALLSPSKSPAGRKQRARTQSLANREPCEMMGCRQQSAVKCCIAECMNRICADHSHKDLVTGYWYCPNCAPKFSYTKSIENHSLHKVFCSIQ